MATKTERTKTSDPPPVGSPEWHKAIADRFKVGPRPMRRLFGPGGTLVRE